MQVSRRHTYPEQSEACHREIAPLKSGCSHASGIIKCTLTEHERSTCVSVLTALVLSTHKSPLTAADGYEEQPVAVLEELAADKPDAAIKSSACRWKRSLCLSQVVLQKGSGAQT